jgi:hypothetical protein
LREADGILAAAGVDALIAGTDLLEQILAARRLGQEAPSIDGVTARLSALAEARAVRPAGSVAPAPEHVDRPFAPSPDLVAVALPSIASARDCASTARSRRQFRGSMRQAASRSSSSSPATGTRR